MRKEGLEYLTLTGHTETRINRKEMGVSCGISLSKWVVEARIKLQRTGSCDRDVIVHIVDMCMF